MDDLTFDEAVQQLREKVFRGEHDHEYRHALNTVMVMWDQRRVDQLNKAVVSTNLYEIEPETLYILMRPTEPRYLIVKRATHV
jgi:hypothetical protein